MTVDVLDYIGKHDGGVLVLLSLGYEEEFYEATFFYTDALVILTVEENLEKKLGCEIEDWHDYGKVMYDILKKLVPYEEIINQIDDFNPENYGLGSDKGSEDDEENLSD